VIGPITFPSLYLNDFRSKGSDASSLSRNTSNNLMLKKLALARIL